MTCKHFRNKGACTFQFYLIFILVNLVCNLVYSQTIDYTKSNLNQGICNLFSISTPPTVNGYAHFSVVGGVSFDGTGLNLQTNFSDGFVSGNEIITNEGTEYSIAYPFLPGYIYTVALTVSSTLTNYTVGLSATWPDVFIATSPTSQLANTICGYDNLTTITGQNPWSFQVASTKAIVATSPSFTTPTGQNYLIVAALPPNTGISTENASTLKISKIVISKSLIVANDFSVPATMAVTCGSTTPVIFTVTNGAGRPGVTGYTWYLGPNNGWLYNGVAAPAAIPTTPNTITLTPICGSMQSNVSATVHLGTTDILTNICVVSITQPSLSLSGNAVLCSSGTYSIAGLPCNASVVWSISPAGLVSSTSTTAPTITLTKISSGNITLTANVTSCGTAQPAISKSIHSGANTPADFPITGNNGSTNYCYNQSMTLSIAGNITNYNWVVPMGWTINYGQGSNVIVLRTPNSGVPTSNIQVSYTEPCGTTITSSKFFTYQGGACGPDPRYTFSPNPAPTILNVSVASGYIGTVWIRKIKLTSLSTGAIVYSQDYSAGAVYFTSITMTGFSSGLYTLGIYDGTNWSSYQIAH